ncbi:VWA domain-containing protein [Corallococcus exercitus]|uniref:VWA domain-containing protein n=1 Tax=Corallococcus exercitus TaxID=2316736 RepID=A0A7Y4JYY9_9BACT|nr:VWA domain-containing protein [Corallococcus exercitus]NOK13786.1 VWA domain-containing protein [Corallococcus exercitus]
MAGHEVINRPFSDVHRMGNKVVATLLHDPTVEGLDVALYMDGSASMENAYGPRGILAKLAPVKNQVEPQMQWMLEYLANKDRDGKVRVTYWASGDGTQLEMVGDLTGPEAKGYRFPGPRSYGKATVMLPVLRDFVAHIKQQVGEGAKRGLAVIITDSQINDAHDVTAYATQVAKEIASGRLPRINFVFMGVGEQVDEEQMEEISHTTYPGVGHLWCHRIADRMEEMAELVAVLVDETMTVAAGGTIYDEQGKVLKVYEGRLPAVLEFEVPPACKRFTLEVAGQRFDQPVPEEHGDEDHHDEDEDEDPKAEAPPPAAAPSHSRRGHRH